MASPAAAWSFTPREAAFLAVAASLGALLFFLSGTAAAYLFIARRRQSARASETDPPTRMRRSNSDVGYSPRTAPSVALDADEHAVPDAEPPAENGAHALTRRFNARASLWVLVRFLWKHIGTVTAVILVLVALIVGIREGRLWMWHTHVHERLGTERHRLRVAAPQWLDVSDDAAAADALGALEAIAARVETDTPLWDVLLARSNASWPPLRLPECRIGAGARAAANDDAATAHHDAFLCDTFAAAGAAHDYLADYMTDTGARDTARERCRHLADERARAAQSAPPVAPISTGVVVDASDNDDDYDDEDDEFDTDDDEVEPPVAARVLASTAAVPAIADPPAPRAPSDGTVSLRARAERHCVQRPAVDTPFFLSSSHADRGDSRFAHLQALGEHVRQHGIPRPVAPHVPLVHNHTFPLLEHSRPRALMVDGTGTRHLRVVQLALCDARALRDGAAHGTPWAQRSAVFACPQHAPPVRPPTAKPAPTPANQRDALPGNRAQLGVALVSERHLHAMLRAVSAWQREAIARLNLAYDADDGFCLCPAQLGIVNSGLNFLWRPAEGGWRVLWVRDTHARIACTLPLGIPLLDTNPEVITNVAYERATEFFGLPLEDMLRVGNVTHCTWTKLQAVDLTFDASESDWTRSMRMASYTPSVELEHHYVPLPLTTYGDSPALATLAMRATRPLRVVPADEHRRMAKSVLLDYTESACYAHCLALDEALVASQHNGATMAVPGADKRSGKGKKGKKAKNGQAGKRDPANGDARGL